MEHQILKKSKTIWGLLLPLSLLAVLLIQGTAFADDGVTLPEPADVVDEAGAAADNDVPQDSAETSDSPPSAVEESPPVEDEAADQAGEDEQPPTEPDPLQESQNPSGETGEQVLVVEEVQIGGESETQLIADAAVVLAENEIALVDDAGEVLNLASEDSLQAVSSADPWWMVGKVKYAYIKTGGTCPTGTTLGSTCFESATPITGALDYMDFNNLVPTDGVLHVEADSYNENVIINGSTGNGYLANLKGLISEGSSATTTINGTVQISNTLLGFKLSGFTITNQLYVNNNTGTLTLTDLDVNSATSSGVYIINHNGAVNIDRVRSSDNNNYGLYLDNTAGTYAVSVTNSEFNHNDNGISGDYWGGVRINSNSTITLNGVSASNNDGNGAVLNAMKGTTVKNSVFNNNFSTPDTFNQGYGLYVNSSSTTNHILLENVQADNNENKGIHLVTYGNITLKNVNAYQNAAAMGYDGIYLENTGGAGYIMITNASSRQSGAKGFHIYSNKNVTLNGVVANENDESGVYIDNCNFSVDHCLGTGSVTISGSLLNQFNDNHNYGLDIISGGTVTLSYFEANGNTYSGVQISNNYTGCSANVTVNLSYAPPVGDFLNSASGNSQSGLLIYSNGNILVDKCYFEGNTAYGAYLENNGAPSARTVNVKNSSAYGNGGTGIRVASKGNISLYNVNAAGSLTGMGVDLRNNSGTGSVTITGPGTTMNDFSGNHTYGLYILSSGVVTLKNIYAVGNDTGANITNTYADSKSVSITNANFSESVANTGLSVNSKGAISLTDVISNNNLVGSGAYLENTDASKAQVVTITRSQFSENANANGLYVASLGTITLSGVQANGNASFGANIQVCSYDGGIPGCKASGGLTINGVDNEFNNNGSYGMYVYSRGNVSMSNISASDNGDSGMMIYHHFENCTGNVSLNATSGRTNAFSNNGVYGVQVYSIGNISFARLDASNNMEVGCYLSNQYALAARSVSVSYATINDNQDQGLQIHSTGAVTLTQVQTLRSSKHFFEINDDDGHEVHDRLPYNQYYDEVYWFNGSNAQNVTIDLESSTFDAFLELFDEDWHLLDSDDNSGAGNDAQISFSLPAVGMYYIRVSSAVLQEYGDYTLTFDGASTEITYANYTGVYIDNSYNSGSGDVKIIATKGYYGVDTRDNNYVGLNVNSNGNLTFAGIQANYNGGNWGSYIRNNSVDGKFVNLKDCSFDNNDSLGLDLASKGSITWSGGGASNSLEAFGAWLRNDDASTYRAVTISNATFNSNYSYGFSIESIGAITLTNVGANDNLNDYGANLDNCQYDGGIPGCKGYGNVTISGTYGSVNFNSNNSSGLNVTSGGTITLTNLNASDNTSGYGMSLSNDYQNSIGNVIMKTTSKTSLSDLSRNGYSGLAVSSRGTISLTNVMVFTNGSNGIEISNADAASAKSVTLTNIKSDDNHNYGVHVSSVGSITLSYVQDFGNTGAGISLNNWTAVTPQFVTVTRSKIDGNTSGTGLYIASMGHVTLNNVVATNNNYGAWISNTWGTSSNVSVLGTLGDSVFSNNTVDGLLINTNGNVSLSKLVAQFNGDDGVDLSARGTLTVSEMWLYRNLGNGINAIADMGVNINKLQSYNNGFNANGDGLNLQMNMGSLAKILNSVFTGNYGDGIDLASDPNPTLTGTYYYGNDLNNSGDKNLNLH